MPPANTYIPPVDEDIVNTLRQWANSAAPFEPTIERIRNVAAEAVQVIEALSARVLDSQEQLRLARLETTHARTCSRVDSALLRLIHTITEPDHTLG